jgi:uncharacterized YigZ family protein
MDAAGPNTHNHGAAPADSYQTLAAPACAELKVQRSRFLAKVAPAESEVEAKKVVAEMTARHHDCRHVCFAWRGGAGPALRELRSDGGEPSGTAGQPILMALRQAAVTDTVAVVARYFGGTKLGTGNLARAYSEAAGQALAAAPRRRVIAGQAYRISLPYDWQKTVALLLARHDGRILEQDYGGQVTWLVWLPTFTQRDFAAALLETTGGEVKMETPA